MVKVYHFKIWNSIKGDWEVPPSKRTATKILELKGHVIQELVEIVQSSHLDEQGRFFPKGAALATPVEKIRQNYPKNMISERLDEALEQSFPASDPVAVGRSSHLGEPKRKLKD